MRTSKGRFEEAKTIWGRLVDYNSDPIHGVDTISPSISSNWKLWN